MSVTRKTAITFIFITILIDIIGIGIIIPVIPKLIQELTGDKVNEAARIGGWLTFAYAIMQFIFSPILGGLSDRFGRRPVLLLSLLGLGIDYIFMAWAPSIAWLFVGRLIAGLGGASFTTAAAYIADVSEPEKRAQNFGMIGAAFGIGFIIGPLIGGLCADFGSRAPFILAAGFSLLNCLYGYFILPESLLKENRRKFEWKRANPIGSLLQLKRYPVVSGLVITMFLVYLAAQSVQSVWTFYTKFKFDWSEKMIGYSLAVVGIIIATVQGGLIRVITPKLGAKNSVYVGLMLSTIGLVLFAYASQGWMMFVFLIPYCLGGISGPALQGIISNEVPPNEQGELQGGLTSLMSVTTVIGPLMMNNLFTVFTRPTAPFYFPGIHFMAGALLTFIGILFSIKTLKAHHLAGKEAGK